MFNPVSDEGLVQSLRRQLVQRTAILRWQWLALRSVIACVVVGILPRSAQSQVRPMRLGLTEVRQLAAEEYGLSGLGSLAAGPMGILAVAQGQDLAVRLFSAGLKAIGTIGRKGAGPGEFQAITGMLWVPCSTNHP